MEKKKTARQVLIGALGYWHEAIKNREPIDGSDMVDWFTTRFVPEARRALDIKQQDKGS